MLLNFTNIQAEIILTTYLYMCIVYVSHSYTCDWKLILNADIDIKGDTVDFDVLLV